MQSTIQTIATVVGALSLVVATTAYLLSRKNLNFSVMLACIERFQALLPALRSVETTEEDTLRYIDLCNEELFYIQHRYIHDEVALEWIEGMAEFLPVFDQRTREPWSEHQRLEAAGEIAKRFPRLLNALTTDEAPDISTARSQRKFAEQALKRVRRYEY